MTAPQTLYTKDATGLKKEISGRKPLPVWVAGLEHVIYINDAVNEAAERVENALVNGSASDLSMQREAARAINVEIWWASWAVCGQIEMTRKAAVWGAAILGALQVVLFVLGKVI